MGAPLARRMDMESAPPLARPERLLELFERFRRTVVSVHVQPVDLPVSKDVDDVGLIPFSVPYAVCAGSPATGSSFVR